MIIEREKLKGLFWYVLSKTLKKWPKQKHRQVLSSQNLK
jgi:hypothetical protein